MNDAQTLTEQSAIGVLAVTCPICLAQRSSSISVNFIRYPNGTTYATGVFTDRHTCQPKETP